MKPIEFWKMSGSGNDFILIDNRIQNEYDEGHIPGSILIPMDSYAFGMKSPVGETIKKIRDSQKSNLNFILIDKNTDEYYISERVLTSFIRYLPEDKDKLIVIYDRKPT